MLTLEEVPSPFTTERKKYGKAKKGTHTTRTCKPEENDIKQTKETPGYGST